MSSRILVLGGGFAGMFAAKELRKRLGGRAHIELVNEENYFVFQPLLPEVAAGSITALHAVAPLRYLLKGVFVRKAVVDAIDFERKVVTVFQGVQRRPTEIEYDHLILALGQKVDLSRMPGMPEHALTMKTLEDARRLRAHVIERLEHAEITNLPEVKKQALTFTVVGGGFSGIETVGEVKDLIDRSLRLYPNIRPSEVKVVVVEFLDRILGELPEELADYAARKLKQRGIELKLGVGVASATGTELVLSNGESIPTRTIVATIGNAPSELVQSFPIEMAHGKIVVDRELRVPGQDGVWSLGDCAMIPMKDGASERGDFAPPTAQFAVREARQLAKNMAAVLSGGTPTPFEYTSKGALASLGARKGVADVMGVKLSGFLAWLLWRAYYVGFIPGVATKLNVLTNWILGAVTPPNVTQIATREPKGVRYALYRAGDRIYETGNRADGLYTIVSGAVEISKIDPETGETVTRRVEAGGHFGDRIVLGETRRGATARALEDTRVLVMARDEVMKIADGFEPFREHFVSHIDEAFGVEWTPRPKTTDEQEAQDARKSA